MIFDDLDSRRARRISRLLAMNQENESIFPNTFVFDSGLSLSEEIKVIETFQQKVLDLLFKYVIENGLSIDDDFQETVPITHINNMVTIISIIYENHEYKDVLDKYENPALSFYLNQIRESITGDEKQNLRRKIESLVFDKERLENEINNISTHFESEKQGLISDLERKNKEISSLLKEKEIESRQYNETLKRLNYIISQKNDEIAAKESERTRIIEEKNLMNDKMEKAKARVGDEITRLNDKIKEMNADSEKKKQLQEKVRELVEQIQKMEESKSKVSEAAKEKLAHLEQQLGTLREKNEGLIKDKKSIEADYKSTTDQMDSIRKDQTNTKKHFETQIRVLQESNEKLKHQKDELELKLMQVHKESVKGETSPQVKLKGFSLVMIDLNNICKSWNESTSGMRFRIEFLYSELARCFKSLGIIANINTLRGWIYISKHKEYLKNESDKLKQEGGKIADLAKSLEWYVNEEKKGVMENGKLKDQDIDTHLALKAGYLLGEYKSTIENFIIVSGDKDMIPCLMKSRELGIKTIVIAIQKTFSRSLKKYADETYFLSLR